MLACALTTALTWSNARCNDPLTGRPPADLLPLMPTALLAERSTPSPYSIVRLTPGDTSRTFSVVLQRDDGRPLQVNFFIDRALNCSVNMDGTSNCAFPIPATNNLNFMDPNPNVSQWTLPLSGFTAASRCYRVDLFASPAFNSSPQEQHLPTRPGDVLHVWWLVVTPDETGSRFPSIDQCTASLVN